MGGVRKQAPKEAGKLELAKKAEAQRGQHNNRQGSWLRGLSGGFLMRPWI